MRGSARTPVCGSASQLPVLSPQEVIGMISNSPLLTSFVAFEITADKAYLEPGPERIREEMVKRSRERW